MILGAILGMLVVAVITFATGKLTLSKTKVVTGPLARQLAIILLLPLPLTYTAEGFVHLHFVNNKLPVGTSNRFFWTLVVVKLAIIVACIAVVYAIGLANAIDPTAPTEPPPPESSEERHE